MKPSVRIHFKSKSKVDTTIIDASGTSFDPSRHVALDALTKAGLFQLKPGKRRN